MASPIHDLPDDILEHIFLFTTLRDVVDPDISVFDLFPLTILRRSSQVCFKWRSLILSLPALWGRSIDLDAFGARNDIWYQTVLERAKQSFLTIRGKDRMNYLPSLCSNWERIRSLDIDMNADANILDLKQYLERPAISMETFRILTEYSDIGRNDTVFDLFAGHSPQLVSIYLPGEIRFDTTKIWRSPSFFTINMRHIHLDNKNFVTPSEVLAACQRMNLLETMRFEINPDYRGPVHAPPHRQVRLHMPQLRSITIDTAGFDIYPVFLASIKPAVGCILRMSHSPAGEHGFHSYAESVKRVYSAFSQSFSEWFPRNTSYRARISATLEIWSPMQLTFSCHHRHIYLKIIPSNGAFFYNDVPGICDVLLGLNIPDTLTELALHYHGVPHTTDAFKTGLRHLLASMHWVKVLRVSCVFLGTIYAVEAFPALHTLHVFDVKPNKLLTNIFQFLSNRSSADLATVDLGSLTWSPMQYLTHMDYRFIPGKVEFIWNARYHYSSDIGFWEEDDDGSISSDSDTEDYF